MTDAGHIAAQAAVAVSTAMSTVVIVGVMVVMVIWMMPIVVVVAPTIVPVRIPTPIGVVGIAPIPIPGEAPVGTIASPAHVEARVVVPVEWVVVVAIYNICVATRIVVVIITP